MGLQGRVPQASTPGHAVSISRLISSGDRHESGPQALSVGVISQPQDTISTQSFTLYKSQRNPPMKCTRKLPVEAGGGIQPTAAGVHRRWSEDGWEVSLSSGLAYSVTVLRRHLVFPGYCF